MIFFDGSEMTEIAAAVLGHERSAPGYSVHDALGNQIVKGSADRLPTHAVMLRQFGFGGQLNAVAVGTGRDLLTKLTREALVRRLRLSFLTAHSDMILLAHRSAQIPPRATSCETITLR